MKHGIQKSVRCGKRVTKNTYCLSL